jgi:hypothetical protein
MSWWDLTKRVAHGMKPCKCNQVCRHSQGSIQKIGSIYGIGLFGSYPEAPGNGFGSPGI